MYLKFFELNRKPFQISTDPRFLWMSAKHKEALAMLKYGIMDNRGFIMLTGNVGTGKTTLINSLINSLGQDVIVANITDPGLDQLDFFNYLSYAFNLEATYTTKGEFLISFRSFLEKSFRQGKQVLLIVDEAQNISPKMLEQIRLLSNIEHQDVKLLNIFLVGQDELNAILDRNENRPLRQRLTLHYHLKPLTVSEMFYMIQHRLKVAGTEKKIFTKEAMKEIYIFTNGYPRLVNIICDHAMISGYAANKKTIDADIIRECAKDLVLPGLTDGKSSPKSVHTTVRSVPVRAKGINKDGLSNGQSPKKNIRSTVNPVIRQDKNQNNKHVADALPTPENIPAKDEEVQMLPQERNHTTSTNTLPPIEITRPKVESAPRHEKSKGPVKRILKYGGLVLVFLFLSGFLYFPLRAGVPFSEAAMFWIDATKRIMAGIDDQASIHRIKKIFLSRTTVLPSDPHLSAPKEIGNDSQMNPSPSNDVDKQNPMPLKNKNFILRLPEDGYARLDKTAITMKSNPTITIVVRGFTDAAGTQSYSLMLSKVRANVVKNYLVGKGISPDRITCIPKGADDPLASNESSEGRYTNRRVEVEMVY